MEAVTVGPRDALTAGFADDPAAFRAEFHGTGANATDAEVQAFVDELRDRYGAFVGSRFNEQGGGSPKFGQPKVPFPYLLEFENAKVDAETEIVFSDPQRGGFINKIGYVTVFDPDLGDLTYPGGTSAGQEPTPETAPTSDEDEPGGGE